MPYGGAIGPFLADKSLIQQAYITSEPCLAEAQGVKVSFLRAADAGWNPYGAVVTVADPPPPWAADFARATARGGSCTPTPRRPRPPTRSGAAACR